MHGDRVLVSGLGIAGPALAYWLLQFGFVPTLVERARRARTGGYMIDFWGVGYEIAERMGLLPEILQVGYRVREVRLVDDDGRRVGGFDAEVFRKATLGRYTSLPRGDLSAILRRAIEGRAEILFGDSVTAIEEGPRDTLVRFEHAPPRRFDLVVGADGLHSVVRALAFGPESQFETFLGYTVAAFELDGYRPRDEGVYVSYAVPGRQVARFAMRGDRTMVLIVIADAHSPAIDPHDRRAHTAYLRDRCADLRWECPEIFRALEGCEDLYFDRVSQIRMDHWSKGGVALVGDAAFAPSLLSGQGSALAILGAHVLAGELARAAEAVEGTVRYERFLQAFILGKQEAARGFAGAFAPRTWLGIWLRNQVTKVLGVPGVAKLAMGASLVDGIRLPDYLEQAAREPSRETDARSR